MVFQKPTPFPMSIYDNIAFGVRLYENLSPRRDGRARRMGADQGGDVGRGEGQAEAERAWRFRAASSSGCASRARVAVKPGSAAARRADLGARPDLDREDRGADHASSRRTTRSPSSRTTCSRRRACRTTRRTCISGELIEFGETDQIFLKPKRRKPRTTSPAVSDSERSTMSDHTHKQFDAEMESIRSGVLSMGGMVEQQLARAIEALEKDDDARRTDAVGADERRSISCRSRSTSSAARSSPSASRPRSTCGWC